MGNKYVRKGAAAKVAPQAPAALHPTAALRQEEEQQQQLDVRDRGQTPRREATAA